jgi:dihydropteroate synthase
MNQSRFNGRMVWNGHSLDFSGRTLVMGILNVTPDSFSDGGRYYDPEQAILHGLELVRAGADIIDIGGESTRPGSDGISADEQISRILPVVENLSKRTSVPISIDTTSVAVARASLDAGAAIINDISGLRFEPAMAGLAAERKVPVIIMHMLGLPRTMQVSPSYEDPVAEIKSFLAQRVDWAVREGIDRSKIILDVGIGFGKRLEDNLAILKHIDEYFDLGLPILVGHSRKGFIGTLTGEPVEKRDPATLAVSLFLATRGVHLLRVHDVGPTRQGCEMIAKLLK